MFNELAGIGQHFVIINSALDERGVRFFLGKPDILKVVINKKIVRRSAVADDNSNSIIQRKCAHATKTSSNDCSAPNTRKPKRGAAKKSPLPKNDKDVLMEFDADILSQQRGTVGRFLWMLQTIHRLHGEEFSKVLKIKGTSRAYFSKDKQGLVDTGASMSPKKIGCTGYWVTTNSNTQRKRSIIFRVLKALGYDKDASLKISQQL